MADKRIRRAFDPIRHDLDGSTSIKSGEWGYEASAFARRVMRLWRKDGSLTFAGADLFASFGTDLFPEDRAWRFLQYLFGEGMRRDDG